MHSLHTALQGLALGEMGWEFVAAGAELEGLLQLLEHLLIGAERDSFGLSFNGSSDIRFKRRGMKIKQKIGLPSWLFSLLAVFTCILHSPSC